MTETTIDFIQKVHEIGPQFQESAGHHDRNRQFVDANYELLKEHGFVSALIPEPLGGYGIRHSEMCDIIEQIAFYCSSTGLAFSMHQHLLSALIWKYNQKNEGAEILMRVANNNLILISTGAKDWLSSSGTMKRTQGGYLVSGKKPFASQSVYGDIAVTSARFDGDQNKTQVLHFGVPMKSAGVSLLDDWDTLGMRGTGSQTIVFDNVFVPDSAITLTRNAGEFHPFWNIVLGVAMPLIMAAYVGIARRAYTLTKDSLRQNSQLDPHANLQLGELYNSLTRAQVVHRDMIRLANDLDIKPTDDLSMEILTRKTIVADACNEVLNLCMNAMGGRAFYRSGELERLFRDVQGSRYHPLSKLDQYIFVGDYLLKTD